MRHTPPAIESCTDIIRSGEYADNVLSPKNEATVQWNYGM